MFMPTIAAANEELENRLKKVPRENFDIENVDVDAGPYIEMVWLSLTMVSFCPTVIYVARIWNLVFWRRRIPTTRLAYCPDVPAPRTLLKSLARSNQALLAQTQNKII